MQAKATIPLQQDDDEDFYPSSDGRPMAESDVHLEEMVYLIMVLKDRYRDLQDVYVGGNLLFGAVGLLLSIPLLRRLHRRFGTWKAPAVAIAVFTVMFSISAFVIGPAISGTEPAEAPQPAGTPSPAEHSAHHTD